MSLFKSASVVSAFTLLSRITGLVRESLLAYFFGASAVTDAFNVAFRIPNLLRRIFAEGAFSQAFVPLLAEAKVSGGDMQTKELVDHVSTVLFWTLLITVVVGILLAPYLVWLMASGLQNATTTSGSAAGGVNGFDAAVVMTRIMFPYILCMSLVALMSAVLNTYKRFAIPAFTPVLLNISMVAAAAIGIPYFRAWGIEPVYTLAVGAMLGGVLQLSAQLWAVSRLGMRPRIGLRWSSLTAAWKHPKTKRMLTLMGPALLGVSVAQISLLINTQIASHLASGSVTWLSLADRLMEFPTAMVGVALGVVLMPALSGARATGDVLRYSRTLDWGLRLVFLLGAPCAVALIVFSEPLVTLLYHYGAFSLSDVAQTSLAVKGYGVGLIGLLSIKVLAPAYYANQNTKTPVKIAVVVLVCTQLLNLLFVPQFAVAGLALSISVGAVLNAAWLFTGLVRSQLFVPQKAWGLYLLRLLFANGALAALLWWGTPYLLTELTGLNKSVRAAAILLACLAAAAVYFSSLYLSGLKVHRLARAPHHPK